MKISDVYEGFLEAEDIPANKNVPVKIVSVRQPSTKDKGLDGNKIDKPIVKLNNVKKEWVLNKTNARIIRRKLGNETEGWAGQEILIYRTTCKAFGKTVPCIRVKDEVGVITTSIPATLEGGSE